MNPEVFDTFQLFASPGNVICSLAMQWDIAECMPAPALVKAGRSIPRTMLRRASQQGKVFGEKAARAAMLLNGEGSGPTNPPSTTSQCHRTAGVVSLRSHGGAASKGGCEHRDVHQPHSEGF